ncbi:hypothetical protein DC31_11470 [Microbacterium sp. CH12i]|nr:hypothetical protein DC31_11470 [Microbacterium sp. CH12i]
MVADDEVRHLGTYRSDDSGNLMPEHRGHVGAEVGLGGKFIAVTETRGLNVDENFTPEGVCQSDILGVESSTELADYCCFHFLLLFDLGSGL